MEGAYLTDDEDTRAWYLSPDQNQVDIIEAAYRDAIAYLKKELGGKPEDIAWIESRKSLAEIRAEAQELETQYQMAGTTKKTILQPMRKISSWIMFYGQVLDVLSQHHPEYLALAWGSVRFVLMGLLNHETMTTQLSQALKDISDALPRMELHAKLYPTDRTQQSMARLYAHLLLFLRQAAKWFSHTSARRVVSSIFQPFELKHKALVAGIRACTAVIDQEASASSKAEIRGLSIQVRKNGEFMIQLDQKIDTNYQAHDARLNTLDNKLDHLHLQIREIKHRVVDVQDTVHDTRTRVIDLQLNEIINNLKPKTLPEDMFQKQQALVRRASPWIDDNKGTLEAIQRLGVWLSTPTIPLLVLQAGPRAQTNAKELAIELIDVLESSGYITAWHLTDGDTGAQDGASRVDIIRSLLFQVLRGSQKDTSRTFEGLDASNFQALQSEPQWIELLCTLLRQLPRSFILVAVEDVQTTTEMLSVLEAVIIQAQRSKPDCALKVALLAGNNMDLSGSVRLGEQTSILTVQKPAPPPAHLRKPRTRQNPRTAAWAAVKRLL
ncbi:hypothetical protein QBC34DRAFT_164977 [Podospora aff. communis PSN243]|uniref:DUF7708 domain-containing protein n=1 Tax=Podospora aff. communis PSN243 TaxID=3040156 RepID=A0AAV9GDC5_9PEZI|nr:hypothetical protein QBC34DRAFT_164977 [Podospora aff. communis PSN243]